jgi:hypothetical protein
MRVINNRGKNREKPKGIEQRERQRKMKENGDMKGDFLASSSKLQHCTPGKFSK